MFILNFFLTGAHCQTPKTAPVLQEKRVEGCTNAFSWHCSGHSELPVCVRRCQLPVCPQPLVTSLGCPKAGCPCLYPFALQLCGEPVLLGAGPTCPYLVAASLSSHFRLWLKTDPLLPCVYLVISASPCSWLYLARCYLTLQNTPWPRA